MTLPVGLTCEMIASLVNNGQRVEGRKHGWNLRYHSSICWEGLKYAAKTHILCYW